MMPPVPASFDEIRAQFSAARAPMPSWDAVLERFCWIDVEAQLALPPDFVLSMPGLIAIRGALGRQLGEAGQPAGCGSGSDQPSPAQLMFYSMGQMAKGLDYPKPFVLQFDPGENRVRVRLFGPAMVFGTAILAALQRIAAQPRDNPFGQPVDVVSQRVCSGRVSVDDADRSASHLFFLTPLVMRRGQCVQDNAGALRNSLVRRVSGILAWYGMGLPVPFADLQSQLLQRFPTLSWANAGQDCMASWAHPSGRQKTMFYEAGVLGRVSLGARVSEFWALFKLGQIVHAGAKTSIGCGRFCFGDPPSDKDSLRFQSW